MKTHTQYWKLTLITTLTVIAFVATSSFAETPNSSAEENTGQMMYPRGMHGGMGYGGMGPGNMGYGGMGHGYMRQGGMAYGGMGYGGMGMMGGSMGMAQALNLDKDQRAKLRGLMREQRNARCQTMNEMQDIHDELAAEYDKGTPDPKTIGKLYSKMSEKQRAMIEQSVEVHNKMRGLLNKEQKETFDRMYRGNMMGYGGMMNMME